MSQCKFVQHILNTKQPEHLSEQETQLLEKHLEHCSSCREHQMVMRLANETIQTWEIPDVSPRLAESILEATRDVEQDRAWYAWWDQSKWFPRIAVAAAAMAVVLMIGGLSLPTHQQASAHAVKQSLKLLQGPPLKVDEALIAAGLLGIEVK